MRLNINPNRLLIGKAAKEPLMPERQEADMASGISIVCHDDAVPEFAAAELDRLYQNIYASSIDCGIGDGAGGNIGASSINTYVARKGEQIVSLLLYRVERGTVRVMNEGMRIGEEEIARFAAAIFARHRSVSVILFHAVAPSVTRLPYPWQRTGFSEDIVVSLPASTDEYLSRLGKATRKKIRQHLGKFKRVFPDMRFDIYRQAEASEQQVRDIIGLNRMRMAAKHKTALIGDEETRKLLHIVRTCGFVAVITADGRICAGAICSQVGKHYFSHVNAHDPAFDAFRLGTLSCYLTICEAIRQGGDEFHLLWGRSQYKYALLGVERSLDDVVVYRSRAWALLNTRMRLRIALRKQMRHAKLLLLGHDSPDAIRKPSWLSRLASALKDGAGFGK